MKNRKVPEQFTLYSSNVVILTNKCKVVQTFTITTKLKVSSRNCSKTFLK